jgi:hypothetical protein
MGFKPKRTIYNLNFKGTEYEGLEVRVKSLSNGELMKLMSLAVKLTEQENKDLDITDVTSVTDLFVGFAKGLVSWNVEDDDDRPVPATLEGVNSQEFGFIMMLVMNWVQAIGGVSDDLGKDSSSGLPSLEALLPMEPL